MDSNGAGPSSLASAGHRNGISGDGQAQGAMRAPILSSKLAANGSNAEQSQATASSSSTANNAQGEASGAHEDMKKALPPIRKRKIDRKAKGILKPAPPPSKAFSFRRDVLQQLNSRLAQQGVNVQVPVPPAGGALGALSETAQEAGNILGGMFKRVSILATGQSQDEQAGGRQSTSQSRDLQQERRGSGTNDAASPQVRRSTSEATSSSTNNLPPPSSSARPLRRVRFSPANMSVVYPISGHIAPGDEDATRVRIEEEHRKRLQNRLQQQWTVYELEALYRECCRMREEHPLKKMRSVFQAAAQTTSAVLKTIDLSFVPLDRHAIEPIADLLMVDFGLQKLVLENCGLTDDGVKSFMHALLVSATLPNLSLASNKRIKYHGWRYVGIYMRRAKALKYLDLSENNINKASLEHIVGALGRQTKGTTQVTASQDPILDGEDSLTIRARLLLEETEEASSLTSLRLENCGLKTASLDLLAHSVRASQLCHLSLRRNRINAMGAVALAIMLKDVPDQLASAADQATLTPDQSFTANAPYAVRSSPRLGDRELHASSNGSPMPKRGYSTATHAETPLIVSSPGGGVTRRTMPTAALESLHDASSSILPTGAAARNGFTKDRHDSEGQHEAMTQSWEASEEAAKALAQAKRAKRILSSMPRTGSLLTLDLKSNDIRAGVTYLSQALKKNRTLKVLNLSDNGIEVAGLIALADALKYNGTLETLDLSHNPCCGPGLEGITTLRTAFALDSNLKRLFLSDTDLSSQGAIALAEFLPEAKSLIHLDLTENLQIDIAGVMALAVSVKMNKSLRCLDLNIPPNAPDFARLSQDILSSCVRNTEYAQRRAQQRGLKAPIAAPIYKSTLARAAKEKEERARLREATRQLDSTAAGAEAAGRTPRSREEIQAAAVRTIDATDECIAVLRELLKREQHQEKERLREREAPRRPDGTIERQVGEYARELITQSRQLGSKLQRVLGIMDEGDNLVRALQANEDLEAVLQQLKSFYDGQTDVGDVRSSETSTEKGKGLQPEQSPSTPRRLAVPTSPLDEGLSSPNFSIGSDDEDDDAPLGRRRGPVESPLAAAGKDMIAKGLGIDIVDANEPERKAAREIPVEPAEAHDEDAEAEIVTTKAKGQLSEEGEIFRRAKSLSIADDDEEHDAAEGLAPQAKDQSDDPIMETPQLRIETSQAGMLSGPERSSASRRSASPGSHLSPIDDRSDVSGEELRRELLNQQVPRKMSIGSTGGIPTSPLSFFQSGNDKAASPNESKRAQ